MKIGFGATGRLRGPIVAAKRRRRRRSLKCYEIQGPHGVDGLALVDRPVPKPGAGEVLVRLKAATLNYRDLLTIKGGYGSRQKFPLVPVSDGAGVIEAIGAGTREFAARRPCHRQFLPELDRRRAERSEDGRGTWRLGGWRPHRVSGVSRACAGQDAGAP